MASKSNGAHGIDTDWARAPPKIESFWRRCGNIFYNPEENSCFGRTPKRWGIVLVFYAIFYAVLAALFSVCMAALLWTLDDKKPVYMLTSSLIGDNPGVSFRPTPRDRTGFIVQYDVGNESALHSYQQELQQFIDLYKDELSTRPECSADDNFGFPGSPCFFIKVNKVYGWKPEYYSPSDLPGDMSEDLKKYIQGLPADKQKQVWVSCWEENKEGGNDTQFLYPWGQGLPASYYPYTNTEGYRSPLVAVKITPAARSLVVIRCRAWAKNIIYNKSIKEASGYARIQLHLQENSTNTSHGDDAGA